jgi:hypothetical protein
MGEMEEQIAARYGSRLEKSSPYESAGTRIIVTFVDGVSELDYYSKASYGGLDPVK